MDSHTIATDAVSATITVEGAELCSLRDAGGREFLWQALPAWPRHAPVLFPIVGELAGDRLHHRGKTYTMGRHGFARASRFAWEERSASACRLVLTDNDATRAQFPFAFRFVLTFAVAGSTLSVSHEIENPGKEVLPASMGAHPAFRWPLAEGVAKQAHVIEFAAPEPAPIRRLAGNLLAPEPVPSPVAGRTLHLDETLFAADAMIFDKLASTSLRFTAPGAPGIEVSWEGFSELGLWMKPGADFLCIEPWSGFASPVGFDGEFADKPGLRLIPPGARRTATYRVKLGA